MNAISNYTDSTKDYALQQVIDFFMCRLYLSRSTVFSRQVANGDTGDFEPSAEGFCEKKSTIIEI